MNRSSLGWSDSSIPDGRKADEFTVQFFDFPVEDKQEDGFAVICAVLRDHEIDPSIQVEHY